MDKIQSFKINHNILKPGVYISRIDKNVVTYDIRTRIPNNGDYMPNDVLHTIEHIFATHIRNSSFADEVVYFGPMGCRTGFYLLLFESVTSEQALSLIQETFQYIKEYNGEIPGCDKSECGNYMEHNLRGAKEEAERMYSILSGYSLEQMNYPQ